MDRRTTLKWIAAAAAALPLGELVALPAAERTAGAKPYGTDPKLIDPFRPGELWPLTFTPAQRRLAAALCDAIIPADEESPSASAVGVVDFLDEWISAPYPIQVADRKLVFEGFAWLDAEAQRRFSASFDALGAAQVRAICDEICYLPKARADVVEAAKFFARYRDLTTGGFYTTPQGRKDLRYVGNVPLTRFDGPPPEVLKKVGLA